MTFLTRLHIKCLVLGLSSGAIALACSDEPADGTMMGTGGTGNTSRATDILELTGDSTAGAGIFAESCGTTSCHGPDGDSGPAADFTTVSGLSDQAILNTAINGTPSMPPLGGMYSDQEFADVLAYINATW